METNRSIFLSHTSKNADTMLDMAQFLENKNIQCWYFQRDILAGEQYNVKIVRAIKEVEILLVLMTEAVGDSIYIPKEIQRAFEYNKVIIPIRLDTSPVPENVEFFLCNEQWVDLTEFEDLEEGFSFLHQRIEEVFEQLSRLNTGIFSTASQHRPLALDHTKGIMLYEKKPEFLQIIKNSYVKHDLFENWKEQLLHNRLLYLFHSQHTGKDTSAIQLLLEVAVDKIYEWSPVTSVRELLNYPLRENTGFILTISDIEAADNIFMFNWMEFLKRLKEKNSYVILIGNMAPNSEFLKTLSSAHPPFANPLSLIEAHVRQNEAELELEQRTISWLYTDEAKNLLPSGIEPKDAENLAKKAIAFVNGDIDRVQFVYSAKENVRTRIQEWYHSDRTDSEVAFYLTLGLLAGCSYDEIAEESRTLANLMKEQLASFTSADTNLGKDNILAAYHAQTKITKKGSDMGTYSQEEVHFTESADGLYIWEYVWNQHHKYRPVLSEWLFDLIRKDDKTTKEKIIELIAHLFEIDAMTIRKVFLQTLAQSNHVKDRLLAVNILERIFLQEDQQHRLFLLAKSWAYQRTQENWRWTAAAFLGSTIGQIYYPDALAILKKVYQTGTKGTRPAVNQSLHQLTMLVRNGSSYQKVYFSFWKQWLEDDAQSKEYVYTLRLAQSIFQRNSWLMGLSDLPTVNELWIPFTLRCFEYKELTEPMLELFNSWVLSCSGKEENERKIVKLIKTVYEKATPATKAYLRTQLKIKAEIYQQSYEYVFK